MMRLFTIGFTKKAREFFGLLSEGLPRVWLTSEL